MNIKRPFEYSFPLSEKRRVWKGIEVVSEGKALCSSCNMILPLWEVFDGEFTYLIKECQRENLIWKTLLHKGRWFPSPFIIKKAPFYDVDIGEIFDGSLDRVKNLGKVPTFVLRITNRCNSQCRICLDRERGECKEVEIRDLDGFPLFYKRQIALTGGEPTVRDDLPEIIRFLKRRKNWVSICTNGLRLEDAEYLKRLKESGLDNVLISFNGFRESIYERMCGGKKELYLKMKALENLKKLNIFTILQVTLAEGINIGEIPSLIKFSLREDFIKGIWFKSIFLPGSVPEMGFSKYNLVTLETMRREVAKSLFISEEYFDLLYRAKEKVIRYLGKIFPHILIGQPQSNQIILQRDGRSLRPLLNQKELLSLIEGKMQLSYLRWFFPVLKSGFTPLKIEKEILKGGIRINIGRSRGPRDIDMNRPICYLYLVNLQGKGWRISTKLPQITPQD